MKKIHNIIFVILGIIFLAVATPLNIGDTAAFILITVGTIFIGIGLFKGNNPVKVIGEFFSNLF